MAALAAGGAALTPTAARADNECGVPGASAAADTLQCTDAAPFASILYPSTSGNLTLQLQNDVTVTAGGIVITPTGANTVTISRIADSAPASGDPQITSTTGAGISVIRAPGNNGNITVTLTDNDTGDEPMSVTGTTFGVRLNNAGTGVTTLTTSNGTITAITGVGVQLGTVGTRDSTFNNGSTVSGATGAVQFIGGGNASLSNSPAGTILGNVFFENTGTATFNNSGVWRSEGVSNLGLGTSTLTLTNGGVIAIGGASQGAATLTLSNLETLSMSSGSVIGRILFGSNSTHSATDGFANDRLVTSAELVGKGRLEMDVVLGGTQADCSAAITADCLDLRGGMAQGAPDTTTILINPVAGPSVMGAKQVLVDVSGGILGNTAFALDPATSGYREVPGGDTVIDTGAVAYHLINDTAAKQTYLTGAPDLEPAQLAHMGEAARAAWDLTTNGWFMRQADQRLGEQGRAGVWLTAIASTVDNRQEQVFTNGAVVLDTSYRQDSTALVGGADIFEAERWKVGLTAGYVTSELEHEENHADGELKGYTVGAYGSVMADAFYLDGIVNYARLDLETSLLADESEATSFGVQAEAGYRLPTPSEIVVVEPLVAVAYVTTDIEDGAFTDGWRIGFDEATSLRAGLGLRLSGELGEAVTTRFSVTGRVWQEFDGEAGIGLSSSAFVDGFTYEDQRDVLGDVSANVSVRGLAKGLSLDAGAGLKMKEDYSVGDVTIGLRYAF